MSTSAPAAAGLRPPGATGSLGNYVRSVWSMRVYAWENGRSSVQAANAEHDLRSFWLVLEPALTIMTYWLVFGVILDVSRGVDNFLAFITVGQVTYRLTQRALLGAAGSLRSAAPMLRSMAFPRAILPLSEVFKALASYRVEIVVMLVAVVLTGERVRLSWVALVPLAAGQLLFAFGVGMAFARVIHRFSDVQPFLQTMMRLVFYASGVIWPAQRFIDSEAILRLFYLNPLYAYVELSRWAALGMEPTDIGLAALSCLVWPLVAVVLGLLYFRKAEHLYAGARTVPHR
jgi:teichoic acid transport system permease protein